MSNSASLSAAKRRRGGAPPPMSQSTSQLPSQPIIQGQSPVFMGSNGLPGLPANFRQLPQQTQQQIIRQLQQKMGASAPALQPTVQKQNVVMPQPMNTRPVELDISNTTPYTVNSVIHNNAMSELNGLSIHDLPMTSAGLPCLPSGRPLPPNVLFKLHHDDLLQKDITLNDISHRLNLLSARFDKPDKIINSSDISKDSIVNDTDFISKVVDNILTNTNLSDIINQIEPLQKENESLRLLINSQQKTLNELSGLVMKLMNSSVSSINSATILGNNIDRTMSNINTNTTCNIISSGNDKYVYNPNLDSDVNSSVYVPCSDSEKNYNDVAEEHNKEYIDENTEEDTEEHINE